MLASPPEIYLKITEIIDHPAKTPKDAEDIILHDPGLAARLLRLVNSAFYGFPGQISSIARAITIIGIKELRDLVLATVVVERFGRMPIKWMSMKEFWRLSVRCALLASEIEKLLPNPVKLESVFVCALLHEIGRLVIYAKIPELARAAILLSEQGQMKETEAERRTYGFDHYQLAAELARRWHLPAVVVTTLDSHHAPHAAGQFVEETAVVVLACQLSLAEVDAKQPLKASLPDIEGLLGILGLESERLPGIIEAAEENFEPVFRMLFQT